METPGTSPVLGDKEKSALGTRHGHSPLGQNETSQSQFRMIDIAEKKDTQRRAVASALFWAAPSTIARIWNRSLPKGDVLVLAEVAGIQGAKRTADLLPLCHPLALTSVRVWTKPEGEAIRVFCEVKTVGKTGVEMEALAGVSAAALCLYDLTKGIDPVLKISDIQLELKEGGKTGLFLQPGSPRASALLASQKEGAQSSARASSKALSGLTAVVLVLSDRCSRGEVSDRSGPAARDWLESQEARVIGSRVLPDDAGDLRQELRAWLEGRRTEVPDLIVTSGGTGLSERDITPETVLELSAQLGGREVPGLGELLRSSGARHNQRSWLSRSTAVLFRQTLVLCLPGSPSAVTEGLSAIGDLLAHGLHTSHGGGHGESPGAKPSSGRGDLPPKE